MKSILFMLDFYYPNPMPNGICVSRVASALSNLGYKVHVIAYKEKDKLPYEELEKVNIHRIRMKIDGKIRFYSKRSQNQLFSIILARISTLFRRLQKLIFLPWFPLASPLTVYKFYSKAYNLHKKHCFDCIIGVFNPDETLFAGALIKRKLKAIKYIAYILDSMIYLSGQKYLPLGLRQKLSWKFEKMVCKTADKIFNMKCHQSHYYDKKYLPFKEKIEFLDIPLFMPRTLYISNYIYNKNKIHIVYMGSLSQRSRNPAYICRLFLKINSDNRIQLHFYSRGDCEDYLKKVQETAHGSISRHGYVAHREIDNIMANSDFLVNIGVSYSTLISSKIFDFISTGKPFIHFYYVDEDVNLEYLSRYPLCLSIKIDETAFEDNAVKLANFLRIYSGKRADPNTLVGLFKENTPMYTACRIKEIIESETNEN